MWKPQKHNCNQHSFCTILGPCPTLDGPVVPWKCFYQIRLIFTSTGINKNRETIRKYDIRGMSHLRIFQRNGLKLDKDLIFSGMFQNVYVYRMAKFKKILPFRFYAIKF